MPVWTYDRSSRRYREESSGRYIGAKQMTALRDTFTDRLRERASGLASDLASGATTQSQWERGMRQLVKSANIDLAALGKGGRAQMTPADWGRVGQTVRTQYQYLGRFADWTPALSEAQVAARGALYVESATASYERARAAAFHVTLPAYPGDGRTACVANCRCAWEIEETEMGLECTWAAAEDAATCPDCALNASLWAPLVFAVPEAAAA